MLHTIVSIASGWSVAAVCVVAVIVSAALTLIGALMNNKVLFLYGFLLVGLVGGVALVSQELKGVFSSEESNITIRPGQTLEQFQVELQREMAKPKPEPVSLRWIFSCIGLAGLWIVVGFGIEGIWTFCEKAGNPLGDSELSVKSYGSFAFGARCLGVLCVLLSFEPFLSNRPIGVEFWGIALSAVVFLGLSGRFSHLANVADQMYLSLLPPDVRAALLAERKRERLARLNRIHNSWSGGPVKSSSSGPPPIRDRSNDQRSATH